MRKVSSSNGGRSMVFRLLGLPLFLATLPVFAQEPPAPVPVSASAAPPVSTSGLPQLPVGTVVLLRLESPLSSKTATPGQVVSFTVARAVSSAGQEIVAAGVPVQGEVIHAAKARWGGKPGELVLAARRLQLPTGAVKLRSNLGVVGANTIYEALVLSSLTFGLGSFLSGGEIELPAGAFFAARTAEPIIPPVLVIPSPAPAPAVPSP